MTVAGLPATTIIPHFSHHWHSTNGLKRVAGKETAVSEKPREWWIYQKHTDIWVEYKRLHIAEIWSVETPVIEKSAYSTLMAEAVKLREHIDWLRSGVEHFTHASDQAQVTHLSDHSTEVLEAFDLWLLAQGGEG